MAVVSATVDGVEVSSSSGTAEELTTSLASPPAQESPAATPVQEPAPGDGTPVSVEKEPDPASEAGKQLSKRRRDMQEAIDRATWEKHEERRAREKAEAELATLKQPKIETKADDGRPKLKSFVDRIGSDFDTYEDAVEAHSDALTDYKLAARDSASAATSATHARQQSLNATASKGREAHGDFDAVIGAFVEQGGRFAPANAQEAQGPLGDLESVVLQHPLGASVAYEVAKDSELRARLFGASSRVMFMAEMGKLLTRLEGAPTGSPAKPAPVSKAKPPVQPAKGQPSATGGPPGDDASDEEHLAYYNQQERSRRRA